ncbi:MAG: hypothetical protein UU64_C0025G0007 [candidate division WWE3 bacterium GW2011_GWF2_41_45]|uniref:Uncharacterized protein n=2 Tax=Katanobacteria TaxID=422282 RepID=A0A1F4XEC6_UNCKA|nr:MAG: hypothetical protein UU59_C0041G0003 [candidate division WWE3 bacterium GW2011_GWE1_41_27]KKS08570.1 MAG: hypothetical protein UU64_C0025G0007 [candidate division WWE3 bacterium GW2011_GWF2_41_45]OGC80005.1 MAG: hypothetical protein A3K01_01340 [candidate division WWE3 bacterium RIFOXYD1_FULL_43_17]
MNLTKTAVMFKRWAKIAFLVLGVYYGWMFFGGPGLRSLIKLFYVTKEPANPIYGNLDPLEFTNKEVTGDQIYKLNTANGKLPGKFPFKMNVYKFKPRTYSYLAGNTAIEDAKYMGYSEADLITDLKGTVYRWRKAETNSFLEVDINTRHLYADSDMVKNSARMQKGRLNEDYAKGTALTFLTKLDRMDDLYRQGFQKVTFGYVGGTRLFETTAQRDVIFARVDLYRKMGDFMILGANPKIGLLTVFVTVPDKDIFPAITYPKADVYYKELEAETTASYPIIDISTAWDAVKNGKGVITSVTPAGTTLFDKPPAPVVSEILVDNIYLAYYENLKDQTHLQPIYVFEAKYKSLGSQGGEMVIYLPAVSGEYVKPIPVQAVPAATR